MYLFIYFYNNDHKMLGLKWRIHCKRIHGMEGWSKEIGRIIPSVFP